ncbi:MAG: hypothetical protein IPJ19_11280 [Planctomycetes bacterium]|nr:hypothetical protein [Planctomycetota bacterium]
MIALLLVLAGHLGDASATLARWREALELDLAREVLEQAPPLVAEQGELAHDGAALALYARALAGAGKRAEARALLEHADVPEAGRVRIAVALARLDLEEDQLAAAHKRVAKFAPSDPEAALVAGRAVYRAGENARARPLLEHFVELAPFDLEAPSAWHMLAQEARSRKDEVRAAVCAANERKYDEWQAFYRARRLQIRANPKEPLPRYGLAELWVAAGEDGRARAVLEELVLLAPDFARAELALARIEQRAGNAQASKRHEARYRELGGTEKL